MSVKVTCKHVGTGAKTDLGTFTTIDAALMATAIMPSNYRSICSTFNCSGRAMFRTGVSMYDFREVVQKSKARRRVV